MGRNKKEDVLGVVIKSQGEGEKVLCWDCFEKEEEKLKIKEAIVQDSAEGEEFCFCDECGMEI